MQTADARRIVELEQKLHQEKAARLRAEQSAAGRKSAVLKLQAALLAERAKAAEKKAQRRPSGRLQG